MHSKINTILKNKTIKSADVNGFGIKLHFTDGTIFDYSAENDGCSSWTYDENKKEPKFCCICGNPIEDFGHDPWPYKTEGRCCTACNYNIVVPRRIAILRNSETNVSPSCSTCAHENEKWNSDACFNCNQHSNYKARK